MSRGRLGCGMPRKWEVLLGLVVSSWLLLLVWMKTGRGGSMRSWSYQGVVSSSGINEPSLHSDECQGKRVFMYDLPREFNVGLVNLCYRQLVDWLNICPRALNWGFGQLLDFGSVPSESALFSDSFARRVSPASNAEVQSKVWDQDSINALTANFDTGDENATCVSKRGGSWFATDPYMLEMIFHKRLVHYRCLTEDPELASLFYLPYYSGLDALRYIFGVKKAQYHEHGRDFIEYLEKHPSMSSYWKRHGGNDHFLVPGRIGWDLGRLPGKEGWGTSLYLQPELENVTFLVLENRGEWSRVEQSVPYPTSFHPPLVRRRDGSQDNGARGWGTGELWEWKRKVRSSRRKTLFAVAAGRRYPPVREMLLNQCLESNSGHTVSSNPLNTDWRGRSFDPVCELVNCSKIQCGHNPQPVADTFLHTEFCLQPGGDTPTRRSTFDSIICGCIPVFFDPASAYTQYTWHLPEDRESYSVFISEDEVRQGKKVEDVLRSFTEEKVRRMRDTLMSLLPRVMYLDFVDDSVTSTARCDESSKQAEQDPHEEDLMEDAFDIALKGLLAKVDSYKAQLQSIFNSAPISVQA